MTEPNGRVEFRLVKQVITMQMLLDHYHITGLRKSGDERVGECPICHAQGKRQFKANVLRNVFRCFVCNAQGDIIAFIKAMESCASLADAGSKLREFFPEQIAAAEVLATGSPAQMPTPPQAAPKQGSEKRKSTAMTASLFLRVAHDGQRPVRERARELLDAHPWIAFIDICEIGGSVVVTINRE
jgi:hypothetical protein